MQVNRVLLASKLVAALAACAMLCAALFAQQLPFEPVHESGQSITGAFEGWFKNPDGTVSLLAGYFNRNLKQAMDIPIGPNNKLEPGGLDQGVLHWRAAGGRCAPGPGRCGRVRLLDPALTARPKGENKG